MCRSSMCNSLLPPLLSVWVWCCLQSRLLQPPPPPGSLIAPPNPPIMHTHKVTGVYASTFTNDLAQSPTLLHKPANQCITMATEHTLFGISSSDDPFITPPDSTFPITTVPMSCKHIMRHKVTSQSWYSFSLIKCCSVISLLHTVTCNHNQNGQETDPH